MRGLLSVFALLLPVGAWAQTAASGYPSRTVRVIVTYAPGGLPDIPTLIEAGIKGVEADPYWGLVAPAGTPPAIITRLHEVWTKHINAPNMRQRLIDMGFAPSADAPAEFAAHIKSDVAKWGKGIREAGVQPQ